MAKRKVTVTLDVEQLVAIRALVEARSTSSVSAFVQHAIADAHVVICAKRAKQAIVTSDPDHLVRLDPSASLVRI